MFCPKCGKEIPNGVKFCPKCGNPIEKAEPAGPAGPQVNRPIGPAQGPASSGNTPLLALEDGVCPNCGSHDCEIQVQQNTTTTGKNYGCCSGGLGALLMGPFGLLCGLCGAGKKTTTTHKSMWVCKKCGNQFVTKKDMATNFIGALSCCYGTAGTILFLAVFFFVVAGDVIEPAGLFAFCSIPVAISLFIAWRLKLRNLGNCPLKDAVSKGLLTAADIKTLRQSTLTWVIYFSVFFAVMWIIVTHFFPLL